VAQRCDCPQNKNALRGLLAMATNGSCTKEYLSNIHLNWYQFGSIQTCDISHIWSVKTKNVEVFTGVYWSICTSFNAVLWAVDH